MKYTKTLLGLATLGLVTTTAQADKLTGTLALDLNSHFISYGADVWGDGEDPDLTFNPSIVFDYAYSDQLSFNAGIWLDVNHGNLDSDLANDVDNRGGIEVKETDIWIGAAYDLGIGSVSVTWQNWQYSGQSEEILDIGFSLDSILSPSITIHNRLGGGGLQEGTFLVFGIGHDVALSDQLSLGLSSSLGVNLSEGFHTLKSPTGTVLKEGETGLGFATLGVSLAYAVSDVISVHGGVTYYMTEKDVIPNNPDEDFFTFNVGTSYSF